MLLAVACGSSGHAQKDAVNAYIAQVRTAQAPLLESQGQINLALQAFSLSKPAPAELLRLQRARQTVVATRNRLRALDPPPEAKHLDSLIARRIRLQVALFDSLIETVQDVRRLAKVAAPLTAAAHRLNLDLNAIGGSRVPTGGSQAFLGRYAGAFGRYGDALEPIGAGLGRPGGTSLLRPTIDTERRAIVRSTRLCDTIRRTLRRGDIDSANAAIHDLLTLTQTGRGEPVRKAQEAAARAYDARLAELDRLVSAISNERLRLVERIG